LPISIREWTIAKKAVGGVRACGREKKKETRLTYAILTPAVKELEGKRGRMEVEDR
jgi:hypothetical protein